MFPIVEAKGIPRVPERIYEDNSRREVPWHNGDDGSEETYHPEYVHRNRVMSGRRDNCGVLSEIGFKPRADNGFLLDGGRPANQPANQPTSQPSSYPANSSALTDGQGASIVQTRGFVPREIARTHATALPSRLGSVALEILRRNSVTSTLLREISEYAASRYDNSQVSPPLASAITPEVNGKGTTMKTDRTQNWKSAHATGKTIAHVNDGQCHATGIVRNRKNS
ncbi:hypothetical protein ALC57_06762 [Trachymyrmex cornetzi]|uniref:Uncharacterized protein n=1 Tax=Trachymyrmex cornetzi TaxID=471704 RepID=A0A195E6Y4_9HYME|nr:hypothetical protein ALC57_06762 [Trachymyrmex cornetzi]